jgi:hypothetical protein
MDSYFPQTTEQAKELRQIIKDLDKDVKAIRDDAEDQSWDYFDTDTQVAIDNLNKLRRLMGLIRARYR